MYESITYAELKSLPKEQKSNAWKELKTMYSTQKELAEKLGVSPAIVYNMVSRYAKDGPADAGKANKLEVVDKQRKRRVRLKKQKDQETLGQREQKLQEQNAAALAIEPSAAAVPEVNGAMSETFSIMIQKMISGENAQFFLNGIGNTLLKDQNYLIEVKITEK